MKREEIIEIAEKILFEYGYIMRPHSEETDNLLNDFADELQTKEISDEEILKEARKQFIEGYQDIFISGGEYVRKWYREQIKQL